MNLDAWQTVWACVALSIIILGVDGLLASRAGPSKADQVRQKKRENRSAVVTGGSQGAVNE